MGRQHQGMDRPGGRRVQEGGGKYRRMEKTGFKIICGVPMTLMVKGLMMMVMMIMMNVQHFDLVSSSFIENSVL